MSGKENWQVFSNTVPRITQNTEFTKGGRGKSTRIATLDSTDDTDALIYTRLIARDLFIPKMIYPVVSVTVFCGQDVEGWTLNTELGSEILANYIDEDNYVGVIITGAYTDQSYVKAECIERVGGTDSVFFTAYIPVAVLAFTEGYIDFRLSFPPDNAVHYPTLEYSVDCKENSDATKEWTELDTSGSPITNETTPGRVGFGARRTDVVGESASLVAKYDYFDDFVVNGVSPGVHFDV